MSASMLDRYDEMLDEVNGTVKIGTLEYSASRVLREVDPTAYRVGFHDWLDSEGENAERDASADGSFDRLP